MKDPRTRDRTRRRRQKIEEKKHTITVNWFLSVMVLFLWGVFGFIIVYVEPSLLADIPFVGWYAPFFVCLFTCIFATVYLLSKNLKRTWLVSFLVTLFLVLRLHNLGQWYNGLILLVVGLLVEYVWIGKFEWVKKISYKRDKSYEQ